MGKIVWGKVEVTGVEVSSGNHRTVPCVRPLAGGRQVFWTL